MDSIKVKKPKLMPKQKEFAKALIKTGNKGKAYSMVYGQEDPHLAAVSGGRLMRIPQVAQEVNALLEKAGMPRDYFIKKLGDLCEAKSVTVLKDGTQVETNDNSTQFNSMKLGMELHGMVQKQSEIPNLTVNYNIDAGLLTSSLNKLQELTRKLELQDCPDGEIVEDNRGEIVQDEYEEAKEG